MGHRSLLPYKAIRDMDSKRFVFVGKGYYMECTPRDVSLIPYPGIVPRLPMETSAAELRDVVNGEEWNLMRQPILAALKEFVRRAKCPTA